MTENKIESWFKKPIIWLLLTTLILILGLIVFRIACITHVDTHEFSYKYDRINGTVTPLGKTGYILHKPIVVSIHTINTLPFQVRISNNNRTNNQKLLKFNPAGFDEFIKLHPRGDYYIRPSVGMTSDIESNRNLYDIFMSYAYEEGINPEDKYPFLTILPSGTKQSNNETTTKIDTIQ